MSVEYLDVNGITNAAIAFRSNIHKFDRCVMSMDRATNNVLSNWVGKGRNQFETQMSLMKSQLDDISIMRWWIRKKDILMKMKRWQSNSVLNELKRRGNEL